MGRFGGNSGGNGQDDEDFENEPTLQHSIDGLPPLDSRPDAPTRPLGNSSQPSSPTSPSSPLAPTQGNADDDWVTRDLPPNLYQPGLYPPPRRPRKVSSSTSQRPLFIALSVVLVVVLVLVGGAIFTVRSLNTSTKANTGKSTAPSGCTGNTACGVAYTYLTDYTGAKYSDMAALTSSASQQRFNNPSILRGSYKNGLDYITSRTADILNAASVTSMTATPGKVVTKDAQHAAIPVQMVVHTSVVGDLSEQITMPLVSEGGKWRVDWSPGLIFPQLDDPVGDPNYTRAVHLFGATGQRGKIFDSTGDVLAQDGPNGVRTYPYGAVMAPVTGYVSSVTQQDLANDKDHYYQQGDKVGHAGLEQWGEQYLRPTKGGTLGIYNRNADGTLSTQAAAVLASKDATNGDDIHTTINLADQQSAYAAIKMVEDVHVGGGVFAVDPMTGKVLVMASYPACDPNAFAQGNQTNISACLNDPVHPLLNFALSSAQPIGSVFKIVTLSAALTHNISTSQTFTCNGSYLVPGEASPRIDDAPKGHGTLTAPQALAPSCDVIFWKVGVQLGNQDPMILPTMARAYGYGSPVNVVGVPSGSEAAGLVPDPTWIRANQNANWSPSDSSNLAIGQGFFLATPAQVTMASAALGNGGKRLQPSLIENITGPDNSTIMSFQTKEIGTLPLSQDQLQTVQQAMVGTTTASNGTSVDLFGSFSVLVAGKTGTAQTSQTRPDAWYTAYAPASPLSGQAVAPQIALTALVENSGGGDYYAGRITKLVLTQALNAKG